jgi:steroid 5-alpha reductase family enzyme
MWWGIFLLALSLPYGWTAVVSPVLITFLLVRVSGVPMLEKKYTGNAEFQAYARRTSAFVPRPPKKP